MLNKWTEAEWRRWEGEFSGEGWEHSHAIKPHVFLAESIAESPHYGVTFEVVDPLPGLAFSAAFNKVLVEKWPERGLVALNEERRAPQTAATLRTILARANEIRHGVTHASSSRISEARDKYGADFVDEWAELASDPHDLERMAIDIIYLMSRLERFVPVRQARIWMLSYNENLNSRPVDAVAVRATPAALAAVETEEQLSY